jgi:hypothetical protein
MVDQRNYYGSSDCLIRETLRGHGRGLDVHHEFHDVLSALDEELQQVLCNCIPLPNDKRQTTNLFQRVG